jgi:hypothetical protein
LIGTLLVLGIILGVLITLAVVLGARRRAAQNVFPIAAAIAVIFALLALLTGHGLAGIGAGGMLFVGETVGIIGSTVIGGRLGSSSGSF